MIRPLELYIGLRYSRSKRRNHFISFISIASMLGIAVGVMALITVLSVMNGFGKEFRERILGVVAHVTISGVKGHIRDWQNYLPEIERAAHVTGVAPYVLGEGMAQHGRTVSGVLVRGVLPARETQVSGLADDMSAGSLNDLQPGMFNI